MSTLIVLATKPFSLFKLSCSLGVRSLYVVAQTWIELLKAAVYCNVLIMWRFIICSITILSFPKRLFTALQREKQLEMDLHEILNELEDAAWDRKELRNKLQATIKEYKMMEVILAELEDEHDQAIIKIQLLITELRDLKVENQRLKEIHGKFGWEYKIKDTPAGAIVVRYVDASNIIVEQNREVAICRSVFSAILSLLVGMIVWEAEDPCMPLVVALFTVVGISLKSVVNFFSTIKNKPASDAVALLSFNCFVLGTLTYPMLPRVACMLAPPGRKVLQGSLRWLLG